MPNICKNCGNTLNDNEKFCTNCGTPVEVLKKVEAKRYCRQCGNLLAAGAKFCDVCGKEALPPKKKEAPAPQEPATMDEVVLPVITEDTFAGMKGNTMEKFDGFESAAMPGAAPAVPQAPTPPPAFTMDAAVPDKPKPAPQQPPLVQSAPHQQITPEAIQNANPYAQYGARQVTGSPVQQPSPQPQQYPNASPTGGQPIPPADSNSVPKKGGSNIAPVILAILIIAVILADVYLFVIKPKNNDSKKSDKDVSITNVTDDIIID